MVWNYDEFVPQDSLRLAMRNLNYANREKPICNTGV